MIDSNRIHCFEIMASSHRTPRAERRRTYKEHHRGHETIESADTVLVVGPATSTSEHITAHALRERRVQLPDVHEWSDDTDDDDDNVNSASDNEAVRPERQFLSDKERNKRKNTQKVLEEGPKRTRMTSKARRRLLFEEDEKTTWPAFVMVICILLAITGAILFIIYRHQEGSHSHQDTVISPQPSKTRSMQGE